MLAPDQDKTTEALRSSSSSAATITVYAGAVRYAVVPLLPASVPEWFLPVKESIATAATNATHWMDELCIDVTSFIPRSVIDYAATFDDVADQMNNLQTEIEMSSGAATPDQRQRAIDALNGLKAGADRANHDVAAVDARLLSLTKLVQSDHDAMATASVLVAQNIPDGAVISKTMTVDLGNDFLDIVPNGPCMVSVNIRSNVMIKLTETAGAHPELLPYVVTRQLLDNAVADNAKAGIALSNVRATWALMEGLIHDTINDLSAASDTDVLPILRQAEFAAARDVWERLSAVAQSLTESD
ncbi:hypothetical protein [Azospirillum lipoferum]|uniref:Uncharacterized protein n=1 Tax=Azospirillum lipoferum (strain 4B) TaxID=862719 RepID=G7ZI36_AZOL4|nr:hypothetical protein [Azospirillum lipoferum]CBS91126.1 Protein of unknown function [Azospirillum lipoferum 4B]